MPHNKTTQKPVQDHDQALLWAPSPAQIKKSLLHDFQNIIASKTGKVFDNYQDIWEWSIENTGDFWSETWDFCGVIGEKGGINLQNPDQMAVTIQSLSPSQINQPNQQKDRAHFFPQARLSYAENLLRFYDDPALKDQAAIVFRDELGRETELTHTQLYDDVSRLIQIFSDLGVTKGDRIAGYLPNMPHAIIATLAANALGALWAGASPDFGVQGCVDRFGQIAPKILIAADGYYYNGKTLSCLEKTAEIQDRIPSIEHCIIVPFVNDAPDLSTLKNAHLYTDLMAQKPAQKIDFAQLPFNHPLFITFSSGTTGIPKSIVHGQGGTLLQHLKEHQLQSDIHRGDNFFQFTTIGWMMWQWLMSGLASGATLLLYDGSPFYPSPDALWRYTSAHQCTYFGTSAKYIDALRNDHFRPSDHADLSHLRTISSTGSPLVHESFDYIYSHIKSDVHLASISGGTDIISCFVLGNPISPVYRGEIQGAGLGMAVNVFDDDGKEKTADQHQNSSETGQSLSGEMVCTKPFPSMPVFFWNDTDQSRYHGAYFDMFPNIWGHGDWLERTNHDGQYGYIIHGRSDATLNPGGVRIGTAEIYRQVEQVDEVKEALAVGQQWQGDDRVVLFIVLNPGHGLDDNLIAKIKTKIRSGASPRHVPAKIIAVPDIPRTKSGKIVELAVRHIIHNRPVKNIEALANPKALNHFKDLKELTE